MLLRSLLLFLMALSGAPGPANAQAPGSEGVRYVDLDQPGRISVIDALVQQGRFDEAQVLLANSRFDEGETGYQAAFLQAQVFRRTGQLDAAAELLRAILQERPDFRRVRFELAEVLTELGQIDAATYHLSLLANAADTTTDRSRFEAIIAALTPDQALRVRGFLSLAPSSNINSGTSAQTINVFGLPFVINPGAQATSGIGLRTGVNATLTQPLAEGLTLYGAAEAVITDYQGARFDQSVGEVRVGVLHAAGEARASYELLADRRFDTDGPVDHGFGARIARRDNLNAQWRLESELSSIRRAAFGDALSVIRTNGLSLDFTRALGEGRGLTLGMAAERALAYDRPHTDYTGASLSAGLFGPVTPGLTIGAKLTLGGRDYTGPFPGGTFPREDRFTELSVNMLGPSLDIAGFSPQVTFVQTWQDSTVPLYAFERFGVDLTFTRAF